MERRAFLWCLLGIAGILLPGCAAGKGRRRSAESAAAPGYDLDAIGSGPTTPLPADDGPGVLRATRRSGALSSEGAEIERDLGVTR